MGMITNDQINKSEFCVSCHQVAVNPGIKLEIVWDQYRDSPARAGRHYLPGLPHGQGRRKARRLCDRADRRGQRQGDQPGTKHANHRFIGPGYPIAHPGLFPHNRKAQAYSIKDWLEFDWRAGWGRTVRGQDWQTGAIKVDFPALGRRGRSRRCPADHRRQSKKLDERDELRACGYGKQQPRRRPVLIQRTPRVGQALAFTYKINNTNTRAQPAVGLARRAAGALAERRPDRSRRQERLGVGLCRP